MGERDEFFRIRAEAFQRRCDALEKLLSCYRTGSQPSERLHRDLRRTQDALAALSAFPPESEGGPSDG